MGIEENQYKCLEAIKCIDQILTDNGIWFSLAYGSVLGAYREKGFIEWDQDIDIVILRSDQEKVNYVLDNNLPPQYRLKSYLRDSVSGFDEVDIIGVSSDDMHIDIYPLIAGPLDKCKGYRFQKYCRRVHRVFGCKTLEYNRLQSKWKVPFVFIIRMIEKLIPSKIMRKYNDYLEDKYSLTDSKFCFPFANDGKSGEYMEKEVWLETERVEFEGILLPVPKNTEQYLRNLYGENFMIPIKY